MNDEQFKIISKKLDALIKVNGMAACRGLTPDEQAWLLHCAGLSSSEIGELLDRNTNAIDQAVHRMRTQTRRHGRGSSVEASSR